MPIHEKRSIINYIDRAYIINDMNNTRLNFRYCMNLLVFYMYVVLCNCNYALHQNVMFFKDYGPFHLYYSLNKDFLCYIITFSRPYTSHENGRNPIYVIHSEWITLFELSPMIYNFYTQWRLGHTSPLCICNTQSLELFPRNLREDFFLKIGILRAKV